MVRYQRMEEPWVAYLWFIHNWVTMGWLSMGGPLVVGGSHNIVLCKVTLVITVSLGLLSHPIYPLFQWYPQSKKILLNLSMKCCNSAFNAQGTRVIMSVKKKQTRWLFQYFAAASGFLVPCPPPLPSPMTKSHTLCECSSKFIHSFIHSCTPDPNHHKSLKEKDLSMHYKPKSQQQQLA
jgi:hypothetical protein